MYTTGKVSVRLSAGDTLSSSRALNFSIRRIKRSRGNTAGPDLWGTDAASIIRNTGFSKELPYILKGKIPDEKIRNGLEEIYRNKGNTYESSVAMTGSLYSLLAVFMHYADKNEPEKDSPCDVCGESDELYRDELFLSDHCRGYRALCRDQQEPPVPVFSELYEQIAQRLSVRIPDRQACRLLRETDLSVSTIAYSVGFENNLYFSKAFRKQKGMSPSEYRQAKKGK